MTQAAGPQDTPAAQAGVPLGGIGAGCLEMGRDGCFRNITINNNRTADQRIDLAPATFLAVRAVRRGKVAARILQSTASLPFEQAGIVPHFTAPDEMVWRGAYPCAHYKLEDRQFPVEVNWSGMSPVIPYDVDAACLPVVFVSLHIKNPGDSAVDVSTLFNWENLCGCTRDEWPVRRGPIRPVVVDSKTSHYGLQDEYEDSGKDGKPLPPLAGLEFGFRGEQRTNAEGNYCLVAKQQEQVRLSLMGWNERDPRELQVFWDQFYNEGRLHNKVSRSLESHSGALCSTFSLSPRSGRTIVYILTWHCPRYEVNGAQLGNGYANTYANALAVTNRALLHFRYYFRAVEDWQNRIANSSLPRWLSRLLVNCGSVLSTNTLFTKSGHFATMESPSAPLAGALDRRFHASLGSLLFFPEYESRELNLFATAGDPEQPWRLNRYLGRECLHEPQNGAAAVPPLDLYPEFVLMAYRNYLTTGRLFVLEGLFPRLKRAVAAVLEHDTNKDGLPEVDAATTTFDQYPGYGVTSYTAGLWLAALKAYARIARALRHVDEAKKHETLLGKAIKAFDARYWDDELGYYRYCDESPAPASTPAVPANACFCGQLAGQWYADFLGLGFLFPHEKVRRALGEIARRNEKQQGLATCVHPDGTPCKIAGPNTIDAGDSWPAYDLAHYGCLLMAHGYPDRALYLLQKTYKNIHARGGRAFDHPFGWKLEDNQGGQWADDRHISSMALWHILYALQGIVLNPAERTLSLRPNLPHGVHQLRSALFTPVCFGWLTYREEVPNEYRQRVQVGFGSPITLERIVLRVPAGVREADVACSTSEARHPSSHAFGQDGPDRIIEIVLDDEAVVKGSLDIAVTQTAGGKVRLSDITGGP